jgi:hypothetical protein
MVTIFCAWMAALGRSPAAQRPLPAALVLCDLSAQFSLQSVLEHSRAILTADERHGCMDASGIGRVQLGPGGGRNGKYASHWRYFGHRAPRDVSPALRAGHDGVSRTGRLEIAPATRRSMDVSVDSGFTCRSGLYPACVFCVCGEGAGSGKGVGTLWGEGDGEVVSLGDRGHVLQILAAAQCRLICCTLLRYVACKMMMRKHVGAAPTSTAHELLLLTPSLCSCLVPPKPCIHSDLLHVLQRGVGVASHGG